MAKIALYLYENNYDRLQKVAGNHVKASLRWYIREIQKNGDITGDAECVLIDWQAYQKRRAASAYMEMWREIWQVDDSVLVEYIASVI